MNYVQKVRMTSLLLIDLLYLIQPTHTRLADCLSSIVPGELLIKDSWNLGQARVPASVQFDYGHKQVCFAKSRP